MSGCARVIDPRTPKPMPGNTIGPASTPNPRTPTNSENQPPSAGEGA